MGRGARRAGGPGRGGRARAPGPRPGRADPGHGRRGGHGLGGAAGDARRSTRPTWAQLKAQQTAQVEADRQARAEASARLTPVTDAEIARYGVQQPAPEPEAEAESAQHDQVSGAERSVLERDQRTAEMAEIHQRTEEIQEAVRRIPDREAERAAEIDAAGENEPVVHEPQAEPELEPSWQQGDAGADYEPRASAPEPAAEIEGAEVELEI